MEKTILLLVFLFLSNVSFCQISKREAAKKEIQTLMRLNELIENDRLNAKQAQEYIFGTRDYVQSEIFKNHDKLEKDDLKNLITSERIMWTLVKSSLELYSNNYTRFLSEDHKTLIKYKNTVLTKLKEKLPPPIICSELLKFVRNNSETLNSINETRLKSNWLKNVSLHKTNDHFYFVIAKIKDKQSSNITKDYIFCDISTIQWNNFSNTNNNPDSFGERFWKYIKPNLCNCE